MTCAPAMAYDHRRDDMIGFLPSGARTVLDIGCGSGGLGVALRAARPDLVVWGVEPDRAAARAAGRTGGYERVLHGTFADVAGLDVRFDCLFFNDVLEHLVEPAEALARARCLVEPGGAVVASIPNVRCIGVLKPLVLRGEWEYQDAGLLDRTHLRFFTRRSILRLFEATAYSVDQIEGIHRRRSWKIDPLDRLLGSRLDEFLFEQYAVVARPRAGGAVSP